MGPDVNHVFLKFSHSAFGHKLCIRLEPCYRQIFSFYFRTGPAASPHCKNEGKGHGKCLPVTCTCLSQTGASPGRHSVMGPWRPWVGPDLNHVFFEIFAFYFWTQTLIQP